MKKISIGDYVLSGGEIPAAAVIEGIVRLIPDIAENMSSIENDSFNNHLLNTHNILNLIWLMDYLFPMY